MALARTYIGGSVSNSDQTAGTHESTFDCGTVTADDLLIIACGGTTGNTFTTTNLWTLPSKASGTATIGTVTEIDEVTSGASYDATVRVWYVKVTGSGTLVLNYGDNEQTYGPGIMVYKYTGYDPDVPILGAAVQDFEGSATSFSPTTATIEGMRSDDETMQFTDWDTDASTGKGDMSAGSGFTMRNQIGSSSEFVNFGCSTRTGSTSTTITWNTDDNSPTTYSCAGLAFTVKAADTDVRFREGVTLGANSGDPETLNPGTDPASGDIMVIGVATSGSAPAQSSPASLESDSFGGTWTLEFSSVYATRRDTDVFVNDDWTTATGTVDVNYSGNRQEARVLMIVEGASAYTEDNQTGDSTGTSYSPTLTGSKAGHLVIIHMEATTAITAPPGWYKVGQYTDSADLRSFAVFVHIGALADTTPDFSWGSSEGFNGWAAYFDEASGTTITLPFISSGATTYAPDVVPTITVPHISSGATEYAPSIVPDLVLPFISSGATEYAPSIVPDLVLPFIASGLTEYAPSIVPNVDLPFIASTVSQFAPTVFRDVTLPFIPSGINLFAPGVVPDLVLPFIGSGASLFAPTVEAGTNITLPFISSGLALYAPQIVPNIDVPFISSGLVLYSPNVVPTVVLPHIASAATLNAPAVVPNLDLPFIASGDTLYAPTLVTTITVPNIPAGTVLYSPTIIGGGSTPNPAAPDRDGLVILSGMDQHERRNSFSLKQQHDNDSFNWG